MKVIIIGLVNGNRWSEINCESEVGEYDEGFCIRLITEEALPIVVRKYCNGVSVDSIKFCTMIKIVMRE